nr:ORF5a [Porcine reproductive and respiratory syndrome virus]WAL35998.1 ORF5a protein [Betaarterivirus suid 1]UOF83675.1 ORF5a [Porcine reproductive and respiratory syndrome virus]UOF83685.1 ORF5a [Porcine reproductive and respiratory syndrome virus]UOF83695.1 ORF5a [Porcine reproductive and respiratory syndrome virus]
MFSQVGAYLDTLSLLLLAFFVVYRLVLVLCRWQRQQLDIPIHI